MEEIVTTNIILKELREFREDNNKKWEQNDKRWEENEKRWEENNKKWEQNEKRWEENNKKWEQNEKRWEENNKKWEQNEKRWEENNKRWEQNEKRWEENNKKWEQNNKRWEQNDKRWEENDKNIKMIDDRVKIVEDKEESNKYELFRIVNVIGETMKDEFEKLNKKLDIKIKKIDAMLAENELQQEEMKQKIKENASKINLCNIRIEKLENWKDEFNTGTSLLV